MRIITKIKLGIVIAVLFTVGAVAVYVNNRTGETKIFHGVVTKITQEPGLCKFLTINGNTNLTVECPVIEAIPNTSGTGRDAFEGFYDKEVVVGNHVEVRAVYVSRTDGIKFYTLDSSNTGTFLKVIPYSKQ